MQNIIATVLTLLILLTYSGSFAQATQVPISTEKVQDSAGNYFFIHNVRKGETLYAISKAYNVSIGEIEENNPKITEGLQIGQELRIPILKDPKNPNLIPKDTIAPEGFIYHKVLKGETLYRISFNYQVKVEELKKHNPSLTTNIHPGDWILIPNKDLQKLEIAQSKYDSLVDYKIGWFDNYYRLEHKFKLNQQQLEQINPELITEGVRRGLIIKVPVIINKSDTMPQYQEIILDTIHKEADIIITDTILNCQQIEFNRHTYKIGLLMPFFSDLEKDIRVDNDYMIKEIDDYPSFRFIEFYQGALLAIDSLKKQGFKAELYVWDTRANEKTTDSICQLDEFKDLEIVIGPFYSKNAAIVRNNIKELSIKMVDIFNLSEVSKDTNTQYFELRPSVESKYKAIIKYVDDSLSNVRVVIMHAGRPSEIALYNIIDSNIFLPEFNIDSSQVELFEYKNNGLEKMLNSLSAEQTTVIINLVNNEAVISDFLRQLSNKKNENKDIDYDIIVMARNSVWSKYKTLELNYLSALRYTYSSDYYINYSDSSTIIPYELKFYNEYKRIPSKLGFMGHDIMWYFGNVLYHYGINFSECMQGLDYGTMNNRIYFEKTKQGVYRNKSTNILQYNDFFIEKKN